MKPELQIRFDFSLSQGTAIAYDGQGRIIREIIVPQEKPPEGTATLVMSIEDYMAAMRALGRSTGLVVSRL